MCDSDVTIMATNYASPSLKESFPLPSVTFHSFAKLIFHSTYYDKYGRISVPFYLSLYTYFKPNLVNDIFLSWT